MNRCQMCKVSFESEFSSIYSTNLKKYLCVECFERKLNDSILSTSDNEREYLYNELTEELNRHLRSIEISRNEIELNYYTRNVQMYERCLDFLNRIMPVSY